MFQNHKRVLEELEKVNPERAQTLIIDQTMDILKVLSQSKTEQQFVDTPLRLAIAKVISRKEFEYILVFFAAWVFLQILKWP